MGSGRQSALGDRVNVFQKCRDELLAVILLKIVDLREGRNADFQDRVRQGLDIVDVRLAVAVTAGVQAPAMVRSNDDPEGRQGARERNYRGKAQACFRIACYARGQP
jgi:hypothetical protein